jgi:hypothetical protein
MLLDFDFMMLAQVIEFSIHLGPPIVLGSDQATFSAHMTITCFAAPSEKGLVQSNSEKMGMCSTRSPATVNALNLWVTWNHLFLLAIHMR